eukprot:6580532-Alexandrium_andersonii.AAC.1
MEPLVGAGSSVAAAAERRAPAVGEAPPLTWAPQPPQAPQLIDASHRLQVLEFCAGSARFTSACREQGLEAVGVEHAGQRTKPEAPVLIVDLSTPGGAETA